MPLPDLLASADFVSLHVSLSAETRHLIDAAALAAMRPTAILVNTARGPVVDTDALVDALRMRDDPRRPPSTSPTRSRSRPTTRWSAMDNCLVVPHIASASPATRGRMAAMAAANLLAGVAGRAPPDAREPRGLRAGPPDGRPRSSAAPSPGTPDDRPASLGDRHGAKGRRRAGPIVGWPCALTPGGP